MPIVGIERSAFLGVPCDGSHVRKNFCCCMPRQGLWPLCIVVWCLMATSAEQCYTVPVGLQMVVTAGFEESGNILVRPAHLYDSQLGYTSATVHMHMPLFICMRQVLDTPGRENLQQAAHHVAFVAWYRMPNPLRRRISQHVPQGDPVATSVPAQMQPIFRASSPGAGCPEDARVWALSRSIPG